MRSSREIFFSVCSSCASHPRNVTIVSVKSLATAGELVRSQANVYCCSRAVMALLMCCETLLSIEGTITQGSSHPEDCTSRYAQWNCSNNARLRILNRLKSRPNALMTRVYTPSGGSVTHRSFSAASAWVTCCSSSSHPLSFASVASGSFATSARKYSYVSSIDVHITSAFWPMCKRT